MTCAICGWPVGAGVYRDAAGAPVHYLCRRKRELDAAAAAAIKATATPPLPRRQSIRRVRR